MPKYTQANQPMAVRTPPPGRDLGADPLLLLGFTGREAISQPFSFHLELIAENKAEIAFEKLLGQSITVELELPASALPYGLQSESDSRKPQEKKRYFNGICWRISQGEADEEFTQYRMELVPKFRLLGLKAQSRIFQNVTVKDILHKVLEDLDVDYTGIQGEFHPRDYCVQYRETDFNFACRLMEEEGIYYYFTHTAHAHKMVLANAHIGHAEMPQGKDLTYETVAGGTRDKDRVYGWEKVQELRSGKYTLWDYSLEKPHDHFQAAAKIAPNVKVGIADHVLTLKGVNDELEIYDYPGEFAQRFDGVQPGGADRNGDWEKIFKDNDRTVAIRMQEEAVHSLLIEGASNCRHLVSGHWFALSTLPGDAKAKLLKAEGKYVLTSVMHTANNAGGYRSSNGRGFTYHNSFTCIPFDVRLPFRPPRTTPKPIVPGTQTAIVVGSGQEGEEILTDKYGRVKVQFHWDRPGKHNTWKDQAGYKYSSCWVQVAQVWAGNRWGASFWPRIGQEVVVGFLEGDMDQPIIIGSVYNAEQNPPYPGEGLDSKHKHDNKVSGIKSNSTPGGKGFNELRFDDTKDKEQVFVHAERNMDVRVKANSMTTVAGNVHLTNGGVDKNGDKLGDYKQLVHKDLHLHVEGDSRLLTGGTEAHSVQKDGFDWYRANHRTTVAIEDFTEAPKILLEGGETLSLKAPTIILEAGTKVSIKGPGGCIIIDAAGVTIVGTPQIKLNSGGGPGDNALQSSIGTPSISDQAKEPDDPAAADDSKSGYKSALG